MKMQYTNFITQRCKYALKAIFELSFRNSSQPVSIQDISKAQHIPSRFLENIMVELKNGDFISSKRGKEGGFMLSRKADEITVGQVIRHLQGGKRTKELHSTKSLGDFAFLRLWDEINQTIGKFLNNKNFSMLIEDEMAERKKYVPDYNI